MIFRLVGRPPQDPENPDKMIYDFHRITENAAEARKAKEAAAEEKGTNSIFKTLTKGLDTDVHDVVVRDAQRQECVL